MSRFSLWLMSLKWLPHRIVRSFATLIRFLIHNPHYAALAAITSILFYEFIYWFLNLGLAQYLLTTPYLTVLDKFELIASSYTGIFTPPHSSLAITLFLVSLLQGIAVAGLVYMIRAERTMNKSMLKQMGGTGIAGVLSVIGLGCAACGTSLIAPILALFFASSSVAMADVVGFYSALIALVVAFITVYLVGLKLSHKASF